MRIEETINAVSLLTAATVTGGGPYCRSGKRNTRVFQVSGAVTEGAGAATVIVEASIDGVGWLTLGSVSLTLSTTVATDGFTYDDYPWVLYRARVSSISGTGASVSAFMSE